MNESIHAERTASEPQDRVTELVEQQTAISEVLRAIASSPHDLQPVFDASQTEPNEVCLGVQDTGPGLSAETLPRLFESILHDKARWHGHGSGDLPLDHRSSRRTAVGDQMRTAGCSLSVYDPR